MIFLTTPWGAIDRRPGYMRQEAEKAHWTCECGAVVVESFGDFRHVGDCGVSEQSMSTLSNRKAVEI